MQTTLGLKPLSRDLFSRYFQVSKTGSPEGGLRPKHRFRPSVLLRQRQGRLQSTRHMPLQRNRSNEVSSITSMKQAHNYRAPVL